MRPTIPIDVVDDEHEFFRDATLLICGSLEFETAMCNFTRFVEGYIPVDTIFLQVYEPNLGAMRTVAAATNDDGIRLDLLTPLPEIAWAYVHERRGEAPPQDESTIIFNRPKGNPVAQVMLATHGIVESSMLRLTLTTESGRLAGIVMTAHGADRYTDRHAHLLSLLKESFSIAIENTLAYGAMSTQKQQTVNLDDLDVGTASHTEERQPAGGGDVDFARDSATTLASRDQLDSFPTLDEVVTLHIRKALEITGGTVHGPRGAGALLGVNAHTLRYRMRKLGIQHGRQAKRR